ncbi:MAG TPA: alanine racemase [Hyphomonadaceae bacterium]|jgi:alanine racemase|nr:alanine racemase [Hyphomonadaceae bacterium]
MPARLDINLDAIVANWRMFAARNPRAHAAAVVKADAYGLGAARVGPALADAGCTRFYVAWPEEGARLRDTLGPAPEIVVFHGPTQDTLPIFEAHQLEPVLNSIAQIDLWLAGPLAQRRASLHLDTGMNRLGVPRSQWAEAAEKFPRPRRLLSHLACGDEFGHPMNAQQLEAFESARPLWPEARRSLSATGGAYQAGRYTMDEIRPGIGLYGGGPDAPEGETVKTVVTLTSPVIQVKTVRSGETVGYGATWTAPAEAQLATVGLGYADGFLRAASNRGMGVIRGEKRPIVGRVSMDLIVIDVTRLKVAPGDEIQFLGPDMPISEVAAAMNTIDYEILTRLGSRFDRRYSGAA